MLSRDSQQLQHQLKKRKSGFEAGEEYKLFDIRITFLKEG
jgi:hypothetical protein